MVLRVFLPRGEYPPVRVPVLEELIRLSPQALSVALRDCSVPFPGADALFALVLGRVAARVGVLDGLVALSNMLEALGDPASVLDAEAVQTLGELLCVYPFEVARLYARFLGVAPDLSPALLAEITAQLLSFYAAADLRRLPGTYKLSRERAQRLLEYMNSFVARALPHAGCADPGALRAACAKQSHAVLARTLRRCVLADPELQEVLLYPGAADAGI